MPMESAGTLRKGWPRGGWWGGWGWPAEWVLGEQNLVGGSSGGPSCRQVSRLLAGWWGLLIIYFYFLYDLDKLWIHLLSWLLLFYSQCKGLHVTWIAVCRVFGSQLWLIFIYWHVWDWNRDCHEFWANIVCSRPACEILRKSMVRRGRIEYKWVWHDSGKLPFL